MRMLLAMDMFSTLQQISRISGCKDRPSGIWSKVWVLTYSGKE
jgi:hypothetical protein